MPLRDAILVHRAVEHAHVVQRRSNVVVVTKLSAHPQRLVQGGPCFVEHAHGCLHCPAVVIQQAPRSLVEGSRRNLLVGFYPATLDSLEVFEISNLPEVPCCDGLVMTIVRTDGAAALTYHEAHPMSVANSDGAESASPSM